MSAIAILICRRGGEWGLKYYSTRKMISKPTGVIFIQLIMSRTNQGSMCASLPHSPHMVFGTEELAPY